jgi:ATP-dependent Lon protease
MWVLIGGKSNLSQPENRSSDDNSLTFEKVKERITTFLAETGKAIRIIGPSGVGKTRSVFEILKMKPVSIRLVSQHLLCIVI